MQGRRLQVDVNDIALKLEEDRMELEQRLRLEARHCIGLDGTPNAMLCHAMPCLQLQLTLHLFPPKRSVAATRRVDFSTLHQTRHVYRYRPLSSWQWTMSGDQGHGATHRGKLSAFSWGTITVCAGTYNSSARPARGAGLALAVHVMWVGCAIKLDCCNPEWSPTLSRVISTGCRVHRVDARDSGGGEWCDATFLCSLC